MRSAHKLRGVSFPSEGQALAGRFAFGHVVALRPGGKVGFRDQNGAVTGARVPRHVDRRWLEAALALAPVPAVALQPDDSPVLLLFCVFAAPEHEALDEHVRIEGKTVELCGSESIRIRAGKSIIIVNADGEVQVRGRNVTSRASNANRVRGGSVRLN
jgi:hypothetical protein